MKWQTAWRACGMAVMLYFGHISAVCAESSAQVAPIVPSYADLVDLADSAPAVFLVELRKTAVVEPERAADVRAGWVRLYVEAQLVNVLHGAMPAIDSLRYLVDVPLDAKGKVPSLKKRQMIVFARNTGAPGELQLVAPDAQLLAEPALVARVRHVLEQLGAPDAPGRITSVYEALYEPGTLAGEGETQIFLTLAGGAPASVTVVHRPAQPTRWSASFSEVVNADGTPPAPDTLAWYRLACFLPSRLPAGVNVSDNGDDKAQADGDYDYMRKDIGLCLRNRAGAS